MLYWNTVTPILKDSLLLFAQSEAFIDFRLVGGTALSLYKGHRMSVDIDLFTDAKYGSIDFGKIDRFLQEHFPYVDTSFGVLPGMGRSYLVGSDRENNIKLDVFYSTDSFIQSPHEEDGLSFAKADEQYDPICLRGKYWEFIKEDFEELVSKGE